VVIEEKMNSKIRAYHSYISIIILFLLILNVFFCCFTVKAQEKQLYIDMISFNIKESSDFTLSVYTINDEYLPEYHKDVKIEFNEKEYIITDEDENYEKTIMAPEVNKDTTFSIKVSKEGYKSAYKNITILDAPQLVIVPDSEKYVVNSGELFSVRVRENNESGNVVQGVNVTIQNMMGSVEKTDSDGRAVLKAPSDFDKITILAQKSGYSDGTLSINVNVPSSIFDQIFSKENLIIIFSIIFLIVAILLVNYRQKKTLYSRAKEIAKENKINKYDLTKKSQDSSSNNDAIRVKPTNNTKVEEIRIIQTKKGKEVVPIRTNKDEEEEFFVEDEKPEDWFKGTDEVRYEIDRLTGEIDEEGKDKWFEGIDDLREKIDEKVKKKDKKKNDEEDN
jgi:hypothetical protein